MIFKLFIKSPENGDFLLANVDMPALLGYSDAVVYVTLTYSTGGTHPFMYMP